MIFVFNSIFEKLPGSAQDKIRALFQRGIDTLQMIKAKKDVPQEIKQDADNMINTMEQSIQSRSEDFPEYGEKEEDDLM